MARQRAAATAGLLAAGSIALPFVFATPALAAPGQEFSGSASANFLTVGAAPAEGLTDLLDGLEVLDPLGALGLVDTVNALLDQADLAVGVQLGNSVAGANAPAVDGLTASAAASNLAVDLEALDESLALSGLDASQDAPPDNAAPDTASAAVDLGPVLNAGLVTNTASARALDADNCPVADAPLGAGSSTLDDVSLLGLGENALVSTDEVTSTSTVSLVAAGQPGLSTQSTATLDVAGLTLFGGTDAETVIDLTGGSLTALVPDATGEAVLDYTAPTGSVVLAGSDTAVALPEGSSGTLYVPLVLGEGGPSLVMTYVFNTITDEDIAAGEVDSSILGITLGVDLDGGGELADPVNLVELGIGGLAVDATNIAGGITCGTTPVTPPVTTPPGTTTPVVNPIAGGPARPAALADTGAEPLPMLGLGLGLLAVGGAALGAGPLRRRMTSSSPSA